MLRTWLDRWGNRKDFSPPLRRGRKRLGTARVRSRPALEQLEDRVLPSIAWSAISPPWDEMGPGPIHNAGGKATPNDAVGAIESVAVEPTATGGYIAYAGTVNGGIWRTDSITNGMFNGTIDPSGIVWQPLTDNLPFAATLVTNSLALDPNDHTGNTLWVGTGTTISADFQGTGPGVGLLKTTDGGATWTVLGHSDLAGQQIMRVLPTTITDPGTGQKIVLVATRQNGIYQSIDGGQTFQNVLFGRLGQASDVVCDPNNQGTFYAALPGDGIYESTNNGTQGSWALLSSNPSSGLSDITNSTDLRIAVAPGGSPTSLWVLTVDQTGTPADLVRSQTSASGVTTFNEVASGIGGRKEATFLGTGPYDAHLALAADPNIPILAYVGTGGGVLLRFGGPTFTANLAGATSPHLDTRTLTFLDSTTLLETDDGGIYGATGAQDAANGQGAVPLSWVSLNGANTVPTAIRDTEFYSVAYDARHGVIIGGTQDNGVALQETPLSTSWNQIASGDGGTVAADPTQIPDTLLYMFSSGQFLRQYQGGQQQPVPLVGLNGTDAPLYQNNLNTDTSYPFILNTHSGNTPNEPMLFGMTGIYESDNDGTNVNDLSPPFGMSGMVKGLAYGTIKNSAAAYFTTDAGDIFVRNNPGKTFAKVPAPPWEAGAFARKIVMDPDDYHIAYVLDSNNNVWQLQMIDNNQNTTDGGTVGAIWQNITGNLLSAASDGGTPNLQALEIYDPTPGSVPGDGIVLVGGFGGVYRRLLNPCGGYSWSLYGAMANVLVNDLHYIPPNPNNPQFGDILLAGTVGRGAWIAPGASATLAQLGVLTIVANPGTNNIRLGLDPNPSNAGLLDVFQNNTGNLVVPLFTIGAIQVIGPAPDISLTIDDHLDQNRENITLGTDEITGLGSQVICYSASHLQVIGGSNVNTFTLANADPVVQTELDTGAGGNTVNVQQTSGTVTINTGSGGNTVNVQQTSGTVAINLGGPDTVTVGANGGNLDTIQGAVTVTGNPSNADGSLLEIDDHADSNVASWTVTAHTPPAGGNAGTVSRKYGNTNPRTIFFSTVATLQLDGGSGGATFQVGGDLGLDPLPARVFVNGAGKGPDPNGPPPVNNLILNDQASTHATDWTIESGALSRSGFKPVNPLQNTLVEFNFIRSLTVNAGAHGNTFSLAPQGGNLDDLPAFVAVNGGSPSDTLTLSDRLNNLGGTWDIAGASVTRTHGSNNGPLKREVDYSSIGTLTVNGGGSNSFQVSSVTQNLDELPATLVTVNGGNPSDVLFLDDAFNTATSTWNISGGSVVRSHLVANPLGTVTRKVNFSKIGSLTLASGSGGGVMNLSPALQDLDELPGTINIFAGFGINTLNVFDQKNKNGATWALAFRTLTRTSGTVGMKTVVYNSSGALVVNGGSGGNAFNIPSTAAGCAATFHGGAGSNTFDVGSDGTHAGIVKHIISSLTLDGGGGTNSLTLDDSGNTTSLDQLGLNATGAGGPAFFGTGGSLHYSAFSSVTLQSSNADPITHQGDNIMVTPQSGMLFTINGNKPSVLPGDALTVTPVIGTVTDHPGTTPGSGFFTFTGSSTHIVDYTGIERPSPAGWLVTGAGAGGTPEVKVFVAQSGELRFDLMAFAPSFRGGVRVAVGDVNGDGIPDIIAAQGPGDGSGGDSLVHVYDGITGRPLGGPLGSFDPFPGFHGGLYVASADLNGDGYADVVVAEDAGGQPRVRVYSGRDGSLLYDFVAFDGSFAGGVRVAAADVNNDGHADVVAAAGPGGAPLVEVFEGADLAHGITKPVLSFDAYEQHFTGGVYVATGDVHGDGIPKILTGAGAGGEPRVNVFDGQNGQLLQSFLAFDRGFTGGVRVAAADVNGDGRSDIVAAEGPGGVPRVRGFDGLSLERVDQFFAYDEDFRGGVFVAGGGRWGIIHSLGGRGDNADHGEGAAPPEGSRGRVDSVFALLGSQDEPDQPGPVPAGSAGGPAALTIQNAEAPPSIAALAAGVRRPGTGLRQALACSTAASKARAVPQWLDLVLWEVGGLFSPIEG
jgi:hypothetical protein